MWLFAAALVARAAPDVVVDAIGRSIARDGVRAPIDELRAPLRAACAAGRALACALAEAPLDQAGIAAAGAAACGVDGPADPPADHPPADSAGCVLAAWGLLPPTGDGLDPTHPTDPARYRSLVDRACGAGVVRGCVELGYVHLLGLATYPSVPAAAEYWAPACDAGDAHACTALGLAASDPSRLRQGADGGDPTAWVALAARDPATADASLARACAGGVTRTCTAMALEALAEAPASPASAPSPAPTGAGSDGTRGAS
ncbi:MAG: hypothetical protein ABMB14_00785, partial [Myxococcota bacterium]